MATTARSSDGAGTSPLTKCVAPTELPGSSREDLCCLHKRVVVVAGDDEEARYLLDGLREGALRDAQVRLRSALDRPGFAAVGEPCAAGHRAATRLEQLGEVVVGVECGLMIGLCAGIPFCLVVSGEHTTLSVTTCPFGGGLTSG